MVLSIFTVMLPLVPKVSADPDPGWLSGWNYRKSHIISGTTAGAQENYTMKITVYYNVSNSTIWSSISSIGGYEGTNPVIPCSDSGWDDRIREIGNILYEPSDTGKEYKAFYSGYNASSGTSSVYIGYAWSSDGITWTKNSSTIIGSRHLEDPYVYNNGGTYYLYAEDKDSYNGAKPIRCYHTTNIIGNWIDDGIVLSNLDGDAESWENALVGSPIVWKEDSTWYMIYEGYATINQGYVGIANSTDGTNWVRNATANPIFSPSASGWDDTGVVSDDLFKVDDKYYMTYHGYDGSVYQSGIANSTNLYSGWGRHANNPISTGGELSKTTMVVYSTKYICYYYFSDTSGICRGYPDSQIIGGNDEVSLSGHCKTDFGDVRFTSSDGLTELDYWMGKKTDSSNAVFWVEIPNIPASPSTATIYIYYGNNTATTTSNGTNTFIFFDDFEDGDISDWTTYLGWADSSEKYTGSYSLCLNDTDGAGNANATHSFTSQTGYFTYIVNTRANLAPANIQLASRENSSSGYNDGGNGTYMGRSNTEDKFAYYDTAWHYFGNWATNTWYEMRIDVNVSGETFEGWVDGTKTVENWAGNFRWSVSEIDRFFFQGVGTSYTGKLWIDNVIVTKFVDPEPTWGTFGSEETLTIGITVEPSSYGFGIMGMGTNASTGSLGYFYVNNTGNTQVDLSIKVTNTSNWNIKPSAGNNEFRLDQSNDSGSNWHTLSYTYSSLYSSLGVGNLMQFDLWLYVPTDTDVGGVQQTTIVTVKAVVA